MRRILIFYAIRVGGAWRHMTVVRHDRREAREFVDRHEDLHGDGFRFFGIHCMRRAA